MFLHLREQRLWEAARLGDTAQRAEADPSTTLVVPKGVVFRGGCVDRQPRSVMGAFMGRRHTVSLRQREGGGFHNTKLETLESSPASHSWDFLSLG